MYIYILSRESFAYAEWDYELIGCYRTREAAQLAAQNLQTVPPVWTADVTDTDLRAQDLALPGGGESNLVIHRERLQG